MKKFLACLAAAAVMAAGCSKFDDSDLLYRVGNIEDRVTALEELCNRMNGNIEALQTLVAAMQNADFVTAVTPLYDDNGVETGYTISFVNSNPVTILHGKNGTDGKDGKDGADGKDGVNGKDGKDYTPQLGVR